MMADRDHVETFATIWDSGIDATPMWGINDLEKVRICFKDIETVKKIYEKAKEHHIENVVPEDSDDDSFDLHCFLKDQCDKEFEIVDDFVCGVSFEGRQDCLETGVLSRMKLNIPMCLKIRWAMLKMFCLKLFQY